MRKLTGYIGAMIIVFALMGSVLLGYALNVNGTSAIVNEYEKVTDISGLYTHSDEKTYIEYAPASNYINYSVKNIFENDPYNDYRTFKSLSGTYNVSISNKIVYINGVAQNAITQYNVLFVSNKFFIEWNPAYNSGSIHMNGYVNTIDTGNINISVTNNVITLAGTDVNNTPYGINFDSTFGLAYCTDGTHDYYCGVGSLYNINPIPAYYIDKGFIASVGFYGNSRYFITVGDSIIYTNGSETDNFSLFTGTYQPEGAYYSNNINYNTNDQKAIFIYYPVTIIGDTVLGVDYTRSNRVNNYPMEYDYTTTTTTQTDTVNLMAVSAGDQFTTAGGLRLSQGSNYINGYENHHYWAGGQFQIKTGVHEYRLSDIFSTLTIPTGTTTVLIDIDLGQLYTPYADVPVNAYYYGWQYMRVYSNTGINPELTSIYPSNNYMATQNNPQNMNYAVYYPATGQVDIYEKRTGVKLWTSDINTSVVRFVDDNVTTGTFEYNYEDTGNTGTSEIPFNLAPRSTPKLNLTYTINGAITNTYYIDITKGVSIKSSNTGAVLWNNQYENGNIDILFRAENNMSVYQNKLTISNNDITVDYDGGHFYVTLNNNTRVDVGLWRNIVLSADLVNGKLYAVPVRTFNSYTNVDLDNTNVLIGDLVNAQPTNIISWGATNKSFRFNIYSTKSFMDTYGIVMINPTLDITQYFTDLNRFYRLYMYNFATYGDSITINGETLNVNNALITYDNKSLQLRNFKVTYADGKVSIGDNNTTIDLGDIVTTNVSMTGAWYFLTDLERGYTSEKVVYNWDWGTFIFDNVQFCVIYLGLMAGALVIARKFCNLSITDYAVVVVSIIIALGVQVIA